MRALGLSDCERFCFDPSRFSILFLDDFIRFTAKDAFPFLLQSSVTNVSLRIKNTQTCNYNADYSNRYRGVQ